MMSKEEFANSWFAQDFSTESDNDEMQVCPIETVNNETAVDDGEAGSDSVITDVSDIDQKTEDHNAEASAGGVSTGNNQDDITMDPVAATESYLYNILGMSQEDVENDIETAVTEGEKIPDAVDDDLDNDGLPIDPDLVAVGASVGSGGAVVERDDQNLDTTPLDNAGDPPVVEDQMTDGPEDADAPGGTVDQATGPGLSLEDLKDVFRSKYQKTGKPISSTEALTMSMEKATGYFKMSTINDDLKHNNKNGYASGKEFLSSKLGKSKIADLKKEITKREMTPATEKEANELELTFWNKWFTGSMGGKGNSTRPIEVKYCKIDGIIFGYWVYYPTNGDKRCSICALTKTKKGKLDAIRYALGLPLYNPSKISIENLDQEEQNKQIDSFLNGGSSMFW